MTLVMEVTVLPLVIVVVVVGRMVVVVFRNQDTAMIVHLRKDTVIERVAKESALIPQSMSSW